MIRRFAVRWSRRAEDDLATFLEFAAAHQGVDRAIHLYQTIRELVGTLTSSPARARIVPELQAIGLDHVRELLLGPYRIFFRIDGRFVSLFGVVDGRRDLSELLLERALRSIDESEK